MKTFAINAVQRQCGECTLCCKVMGIKEDDFQKPKDEWCQHAKKKCGCSIYDTRPSICKGFECLWLRGQFGGPELRPDKIHGVVTPTTDGLNWVVHEDIGYPGVARLKLMPIINTWLAQKLSNYVIIVTGTQRTYLGHPETLARLRGRVDELSGMRDERTIRALDVSGV